nr:hypothetical protein [Candidatus Freyarchaeota archaeon]
MKLVSKVPSTKLSPEYFLPLLKIISKYEGSIEDMKENIHIFLTEVSKRGKRNQHNSVYAITFPTFKRLNLIEGEGKSIKLSQDGKTLIEVAEKEGETAYKKKLAKLVLRTDQEKAHVIDAVLSSGKEVLTIDDLVNVLKSSGIETNEKDDRLLKWLRILVYLDFIERLDGKFKFNRLQVEGVKSEKNVSPPVFADTLIETYNKLKSEKMGSPYIPIPLIEKEVCKNLSEYGFTTFDFREHLLKLKAQGLSDKKIIFTKPGARESGGLKINNNYYYYIAIFEG